MSYNKKGLITTISAITDAGAGKKLTFRIDTGEDYDKIWEFEMYKKAEYVEHLDSFIKFNKVGDSVDVEFNIKSRSWTNPATNIERMFTSLSAWRVDKVDGDTPPQSQETPLPAGDDTGDALPF